MTIKEMRSKYAKAYVDKVKERLGVTNESVELDNQDLEALKKLLNGKWGSLYKQDDPDFDDFYEGMSNLVDGGKKSAVEELKDVSPEDMDRQLAIYNSRNGTGISRDKLKSDMQEATGQDIAKANLEYKSVLDSLEANPNKYQAAKDYVEGLPHQVLNTVSNLGTVANVGAQALPGAGNVVSAIGGAAAPILSGIDKAVAGYDVDASDVLTEAGTNVALSSSIPTDAVMKGASLLPFKVTKDFAYVGNIGRKALDKDITGGAEFDAAVANWNAKRAAAANNKTMINELRVVGNNKAADALEASQNKEIVNEGVKIRDAAIRVGDTKTVNEVNEALASYKNLAEGADPFVEGTKDVFITKLAKQNGTADRLKTTAKRNRILNSDNAKTIALGTRATAAGLGQAVKEAVKFAEDHPTLAAVSRQSLLSDYLYPIWDQVGYDVHKNYAEDEKEREKIKTDAEKKRDEAITKAKGRFKLLVDEE